MTNKNEIANFYERDIRKLIDEINSFKNEENLWRTSGTIKNSAGNLALHIIGGLSYLIGATLSHTGYVRNRDHITLGVLIWPSNCVALPYFKSPCDIYS